MQCDATARQLQLSVPVLASLSAFAKPRATLRADQAHDMRVTELPEEHLLPQQGVNCLLCA